MALLEPTAPTSVGSSLFGIPMKHVSLITLTFQNSALILILHYSRVMKPDGDHRYFASTAVFLNEILKLAISLTFMIYEVSRTLAPQTPATIIFEQIYNSVFCGDGWKLAIPSALYILQNSLQYVALGNLDAVHFQILYQLKILTTAFFSMTMLGRTLGPRRWFSLVLLTIGVSIVSLPSDGKDPATMIHDFSDHFFPRSLHELGQSTANAAEVAHHLTRRAVSDFTGQIARRSASYEGIQEDQAGMPAMSYSIGLTAVLIAAAVSGLTGVYFEKVLKESPTPVSVWTRNVQLSFYSLFPALFVGVIYVDGEDIAKHGFFDGYNWVVWTSIVFQAAGGVLTSLCIHYADNIAKNFATSISIIISFLISVCFFRLEVNVMFLVGTLLVMVATFLYGGPERKRGRPPPISIVSFEKATVDSTPKATPSYLDDQKLSIDPLESVKSMGLSTSRPSSPLRHHHRVPSARGKSRDE